MGKKMKANRPLFQSKKNVESSPDKKAKPTISSNAATIRGHSLLIFARTGCSMRVVNENDNDHHHNIVIFEFLGNARHGA